MKQMCMLAVKLQHRTVAIVVVLGKCTVKLEQINEQRCIYSMVTIGSYLTVNGKSLPLEELFFKYFVNEKVMRCAFL